MTKEICFHCVYWFARDGQSTHRRKKSNSKRFHTKAFKYLVVKSRKLGLSLLTFVLSPHRETTCAKRGLSNINVYASVCRGGGISIGY